MTFSVRDGAKASFAGSLAAAIWAVQQPLDKKLTASEYDDVELLGKLVTPGALWYPIGLVWHLFNGALFGIVYAAFVDRHRRWWVWGTGAAMAEFIGTWPAGRISDRLHPRRKDLPQLTGNRRAFIQSAWRHLLFGLCFGAIYERVSR